VAVEVLAMTLAVLMMCLWFGIESDHEQKQQQRQKRQRWQQQQHLWLRWSATVRHGNENRDSGREGGGGGGDEER
jgi:hypothetical protein